MPDCAPILHQYFVRRRALARAHRRGSVLRTCTVFAVLFAVAASLTLLAVSPPWRSSRALRTPAYPRFSGQAFKP